MVNMADVAEKAGVSTATVSHVINGTRFVREETKQKVYEAMDELNYHPNFAARSLRSNKSYNIGFIAPDVANPFYMNLIKGAETYLRKEGYNLIVSNSDDSLEIEKKQLKIFNAQLIDGLIMRSTPDDHGFLDEYIEDVPTVFIDCKPKNYDEGDSVLVENKKGAYEAISLLLEKGNKKIGMIAGIAGLTSTEERISGYIKAFEDRNLSVPRSLIKVGNSRVDSGYRYMKELVEKNDITAVFTGNNLITIGVMEYLKEKELSIPDDMAIISFDDQEWFSITNPAITAIKQPTYQIGEKAAEMLIYRIQNNCKGNYKNYRFPIKLIKRDSH